MLKVNKKHTTNTYSNPYVLQNHYSPGENVDSHSTFLYWLFKWSYMIKCTVYKKTYISTGVNTAHALAVIQQVNIPKRVPLK